ncbi:MAG: TonB-dependent receptor plug domain-containing protein [Gammaproteobacteria bacterium]|nr:TonB-dependent receptor plug domain-containing protein [Gammaproteobacteria bacterium]MYF01759.1 TonB-dependent receptor plug domain-containing protein [Gammaproteobacteria bacterium]
MNVAECPSIRNIQISLLLLAFLGSAQAYSDENNPDPAEDKTSTGTDTIEEVVVTGTYIPTGIHPAAVPITSISSEDLTSTAPSDFKDVIRNLSFNVSSLGLSSTNWVGDNSSYGSASINVRNLGNGATLVLLNGKRVIPSQFNQNGGTYVDIQTLVPNIALARVDILKEGTSAIYGSDAVAGVVNLITKDDFQGLEIQFYASLDHESRTQSDKNLEVLYGTGDERNQFTISASILDRSALTYTERYDRFGKSGLSSFGQPGRYVPLVVDDGPTRVSSNFWWPNGGPDDTSLFQGSLPDLECEQVAAVDRHMGTLGLHPNFPHICVYDYSSFFWE